MDKKWFGVFACFLVVWILAVGCGSEKAVQEDLQKSTVPREGSAGTYAIVTKAAGNPYNEKEAQGFREIIEKAGGKCIVRHPESATVEAQLSEINDLTKQNVDTISVAGNGFDALEPVLEAAMEKGIQVSSLDSNVNASSRMTFVNPAGIQEIGRTLMDAVWDISGGEGQWAILSATNLATNQNAWIDAMQRVMEEEKYAALDLVEIAYGDDEYGKSADKTKELLESYPNLKVICAPTVVGIHAAAEVIEEEAAQNRVRLTGLGMPSVMAEYIGQGKACPYMFLWNPTDVGRLSAYVSLALHKGTITGAVGETFRAGDMGEYTITQADDGGTEVIVGPPLRFDSDNIDEWKDVY